MFNIVTACSRPENLSIIYESIKPFVKDYEVVWHIAYDKDHIKGDITNYNTTLNWDVWVENYFIGGGVTGSRQRNLALYNIEGGLVYFLDDDNILHKDLIPTIHYASTMVGNTKKAFVFDQRLEHGYRKARYEDIRVTHIDTAQFVVDRELIGNLRFKDDYCADGYFIEELYNKNKDKFMVINEELSYYNYLRWEKRS